MKAYFQNEEYELNKEFIEKLQKMECDISDFYDIHVLSVKWNDEHDCLEFYFEGPFEC